MGYSTNRETLAKIRSLLEPLERDESVSWNVREGDETYWMYKIREGLYIAKLYPQEYPELAVAAGAFKIEYVRPGKIQAVPARQTTEVEVLRGATPTTGLDSDPRGLYTGRKAELLGQKTPESIMEAWFAVQPSNTPLHFPDAQLQPAELQRLYALASEQHLIFFVTREGALTLQKKERGLEGLEWTPADLVDESPVFMEPLPREEEQAVDPRLEPDDEMSEVSPWPRGIPRKER